MKIELDMYQTIAVAVVVLMLGKFLKTKFSILERFCIPAPVIGGVLFAVFTCLCYVTGIVEFSFDDILKEVCMVFFFTSVGFQANLKVLKSGGKSIHQAQQFGRSVRARSQPPCLAQLGGIQADQQIGQVGEQKFFQIELSHRSCSLRFSRFGTGAFTSSLNFLSLPSTDSRRCSFFRRFLEYFWKAAFMLASLGALKNI